MMALVIGVRGINPRVILRVSTLQITADRGTGRNPGATNFSRRRSRAAAVVEDAHARDAPCGECRADVLADRAGLEHDAHEPQNRLGRRSVSRQGRSSRRCTSGAS